MLLSTVTLYVIVIQLFIIFVDFLLISHLAWVRTKKCKDMAEVKIHSWKWMNEQIRNSHACHYRKKDECDE